MTMLDFWTLDDIADAVPAIAEYLEETRAAE